MLREQFLSLFNFDTNYFYWKVLVVAIILCKVISIRQTQQLTFYYNKKDRLMSQFLEQSKVAQLVYKPYWLTITPLLQSLTYMLVDEFQKYWFPEKFDREVITVEDGGTLGIDWAIDRDTGCGRPNVRHENKRQPILLISPGLGGGSRNLYTLGLMWAARKSGFKVGTMLFRGAEGLTITSNKISYSGAWQDCKAIIEHVNEKYVLNESKTGRRCRMYAYGCSLGAQILALYLRKEGQKACNVLDGACVYGTPWSISKGSKFFYENAFGIYQKVIGLNLSEIIRKEQLPALKAYVSEEDYAHYKHALDNNWSGMDVLDEQIYVKMFGFASKQAYYDAVTIAEHVTDIKVPTFSLDAKDDQICGGLKFAPAKAVQGHESKVMLGMTDFGAHVCHMQGHLIPKPWYTAVMMEWLQFMEARNTFKKK